MSLLLLRRSARIGIIDGVCPLKGRERITPVLCHRMTILQLPQRAGIPYCSMVAASTPLDRPNSALNSPAVEAVLGSEGAVSTAAVVPILRALGGTASTNQRAYTSIMISWRGWFAESATHVITIRSL